MNNGGATIGGIPYNDLGLLLLKSDIPLLPETRQIEEEIPGMDGALDVETRYSTRLIEHEVMFHAGGGEGEFQTRLAALAKALNPKKGQQPLVEDRQSGKRWMVKYNGNLPIEKIATIGQFTIPYKAFFPFSESVLDTTTPLKLGQGYTLGMGLTLGMSNYTYEIITNPKTVDVYHAGTHEVYPTIRLSGTGSNIALTNETTDETLGWSGSLATNDVLEIECSKKRITKNGANAFGQFAGVFPRLVEGNNEITIEATGPNLTVAFVFRHTYLY